ncbi:MAG: hypothetical protein AB8H80_14715, partial [Planctomycetota bacterium]
MSKTTILAVSLAAWSSIGQATAQDRPSAGTSIASTLATAKLTEVRGDLALAQSQLEAAIHGASAEERAQLRAVLLQLRQRSGADTVESTSISAAAAQGQEPGKADPVMRLVRKLDEGTTANKDVEFAVTELRSLGRLIDTALIAELPKLGPFGLDNAMTLLNGSEHPTLLPTLESMLAKGDPAVAQALALRHVKMRSSIAIPLARRFAGQEYSAQTRFYALAVLLRHTDVDQGTLALLAELAEDKSVRKDLLDLAERDRGRDRVRAAARNALLEQLARTPDRAGFRARSLLLVAEQNLEEAQAVEQLMLLPDDLRGRIARQLAMKHTAWVEVAAMAIGVEDQSLDEWWVSKVEWSRQPDVAMRALLRRPDLAMANQLPISIASLVENGWTLSEELEAPFLRYIERSNGWWTLVGALPIAPPSAPALLAGVASAIASAANLHGDARHLELALAICRIPHS